MRTGLSLLGIRFEMDRRLHRRWLVVTAYVLIGILIAGEWLVAQRWPSWISLYVIFIVLFGTNFINDYLGGGRGSTQGLIKPFDGNETLRKFGYNVPSQDIPKYLKGKYMNDEWDLHRRNDAHWRAYRWLGLMIALPWAVAGMELPTADMPKSHWFSRYASSYEYHLLICCLLTALLCVYITLPQAILLWTEPDMEEQ